MKLLFDQNISHRVVNLLKTEFEFCLTVKEVDLLKQAIFRYGDIVKKMA